jgi:hypothetical protein
MSVNRGCRCTARLQAALPACDEVLQRSLSVASHSLARRMLGVCREDDMMKHRLRVRPYLFFFCMLALTALIDGCSPTTFVSSWRSPTAQPLQPVGAKVAAVVMMQDEPSRRSAEDWLARAISSRGAIGIPMYKLLPNGGPNDEAQARAALARAQVQGVVVMRPLGVTKDVTVAPAYGSPYYSGYWGGYYGYGWGSPWGSTTVYTDTTVSVETLVYSLKQNQLVWGGRSKTTNPENVNQLISEVASAAADELSEQGLLAH